VSKKNRSAVALGRRGGKATSDRKARASRENGKKGGRPKKETPAMHIRQPMPLVGGNSFYRDKTDYSHHAMTLCGAPITGKDVDFRTAGTKTFRSENWPTCPACVAIRAEATAKATGKT
jgi:hypothetical protein